MGFDDFFEHGHKRHHHGYDHHQKHDDYYHNEHSSNYHYDLKRQLLEKFRNNPNFRKLAILAAVIIVIIAIVAAIILIPLIIKLFHYVSQNGIKGIIDAIWNGTK